VLLPFLVSKSLFNNIGGEFIPTLEEGDLTVEIAMSQGTSLSATVDAFSKAERIIKKNFPEVKQVVTRIGSSEIPTDPMPIERGDMMVVMKPKEEWTSAETREEMMEKMEEALSILPGLRIEITQPMQMRFNELMTGIRQDVAVKIYGDDIEILAQQANKVANLIKDVKGLEEPFVEKVSGLPQITVEYNRDKMAQYGLHVNEVNMILQTAFAGKTSGVVFENDKRFDIVVRLERESRENIASIENLFIPLPNNNRVPLSDIATVTFIDAPAQVSREDGKRRTFVGFNVRGRDVESAVKDIQAILDKNLKLPEGYYLTYGGQFQNLIEAKTRLAIAVPVALLLILVLLFATFRSITQTLLIATAVPLSAIGGVFALVIRGMPFSISAGVGFIALFGVAVLNGIVLIGYFNQLKIEGMQDIYQRVREGTRVRLRPVIMTAAVASLGFLPMALSTGAGGEVQKPLATVVIGGLITATFLTLFVLPCLYILTSKKIRFRKPKKIITVALIPLFLISMLGLSFNSQAQSPNPELNNLIEQAKQNNLKVKRSGLEIEQTKVLQKSAFDIPRTSFLLAQDPTSGGNIDNSIGLSQSISMPGVYKSQRKVFQEQTKLAQANKAVTEAEIVRNIKLAYYGYLFTSHKLQLLNYLDSIYQDFADKAKIRYTAGETSNLERLTAENRYQNVQLQKRETLADLKLYEYLIRQQINTDVPINVNALDSNLFVQKEEMSYDTAVSNNPLINYYKQNIAVAQSRVAAERAKRLPEFSATYYHQFVAKGFDPAKINRQYFPGTRIGGFEIGVTVPLFAKSLRARVQAEKIATSMAQSDLAITQWELSTQNQQAFQQYIRYSDRVAFYERNTLQLANEQIRVSLIAFRLGEIEYVELFQNLSQATETRLQYLETVRLLNEAIININYLKGNQ